ncbi:hypothetical protein Tco_0864537 [Tanacetum coccineum]
MDTESEPFENLVEIEAPKSPYTVAPPTSLPDSTPTTLVPILHRTVRMAVRVPPAMSSYLYASIAEVAAMFASAFLEGDEDDEEEDEEIEESSDSDSESEDAEDEGPSVEDEDPTAGDEGLAAGVEGPGMRDESLSLGGDEAIPEGQQRTTSVIETAVAPHVQTPSLPEWSSGSLPISLAPSVISSPILSPMIPLTVPSPVASPTTAETEGFLTELEARVEM